MSETFDVTESQLAMARDALSAAGIDNPPDNVLAELAAQQAPPVSGWERAQQRNEATAQARRESARLAELETLREAVKAPVDAAGLEAAAEKMGVTPAAYRQAMETQRAAQVGRLRELEAQQRRLDEAAAVAANDAALRGLLAAGDKVGLVQFGNDAGKPAAQRAIARAKIAEIWPDFDSWYHPL